MLAWAAALLLAVVQPAQAGGRGGHYLFVWAGDQAKLANDFLVVIDVDPRSPAYGRITSGVGTNIKSVRIHHTEYEMPASGMLFANDHDANKSVIFDLRDPLKPKVAHYFQSLGGYAMPHSFLRLPNGRVLSSFQFADRDGLMVMDGKTGGLVEIADSGVAIRSASNADPAFAGEGLLPYSLAVLPGIDRVLVTNSPMGDDYLLTTTPIRFSACPTLSCSAPTGSILGRALTVIFRPKRRGSGQTALSMSRLCPAESSASPGSRDRRQRLEWFTNSPAISAGCQRSSDTTSCRACLRFMATPCLILRMVRTFAKYRG
ncbi:MAG: hypothetical protein ABI770_08080 [Sphingomicrobium sp.]